MKPSLCTIRGYFLPASQQKKDEEGDEDAEEDDEDDFDDIDDLEGMSRSDYRSRTLKRQKLQFSCVTSGRLYEVTGVFPYTQPWLEATITTKSTQSAYKYAVGYPSYAVRTDPRVGRDEVIFLFLEACGVHESHRNEFWKHLQGCGLLEYLSFDNLPELLGEFGAANQLGKDTVKQIAMHMEHSDAGQTVWNLRSFPLTARFVPQLLPKHIHNLVGGSPKDADDDARSKKEIREARRARLQPVEAALTNTPWVFGFRKILSQDLGLYGMEAMLRGYQQSGLMENVVQPYADALVVYDLLKMLCQKYGHTYVYKAGLPGAPMLKGQQLRHLDAALAFLESRSILHLEAADGGRRTRVYLRYLYDAEVHIACDVGRLFEKHRADPWTLDIDLNSPRFSQLTTDADQTRAARLIGQQPVVVISGKGGCGKTTVVSAVMTLAEDAILQRKSDEAFDLDDVDDLMLTQACQEAEVAAGVTQTPQDASFDGEEDDETIQCSQKYQHWNDGVGTSLDRTDKDADDSESELSHLLEAISRHDNPAPSGNGNDTVGQLSNAISGLSDASNHLSSATDHLDNMLRNHSDITTNDQAQVTREKHSNMVVSQCSDGPLDLVNNNENDDVTIWSTASDNPTAAAASDACASDQQENSTDPCSAECEEDRNDPCPSAHDDPDAPSSPVPEPRERRQILENPVVLLTAPTGKAANLLGKRAQLPGVTIHRVVYSYYYHMASCRKAEREETPPPSWIFADVEALVVDECSLVGVRLFSVLLRCLLEQARLRKVVLLGDVNQLPSIEPGAFLSDMFDSLDRVGVSVLLTTNHRSEAALIVNNAAAIANQELPQIDPKRNFHQITIGAEDDGPRGGSQQEEDDMSCDRDRAVRCLLNGEFPGVNSDRTSQFVAFRRKDCEAINELCCLHYAKHATRTPHGRRDFRRNDKVCCTKNGDVHVEKGYTDYSSGVAVSEDFTVRLSNGEIFFIVDILQEQGAKDTKATEFFVLHDPDRSGTEMHYIKVKARELVRTCRLQHAWARTIHTYQGSEAACVVYMVGAPGGQNWQHVYTAVTRGRTQVVLITRTQHLHTCVRSLPLRRQTSLRSHLGDVVTRLDRATWPLCASQRGGTAARAWADTVKQQRRLLADSPPAWNTMRPGISGFQPASQNSQSGWNSQNSRGNSISHGVVRKLPLSNDTSEISSVFTNQASTSKNTRTFPKKNESSSDGRNFSDWDDSLEETMLGFASQNHHETTTKGQSASSSAGCDRLYPDLSHLQAAESHPPHPPTSQGLTPGAPGDSPAPSSQMFKAGGFVASTQVASAPRLYPDIEAELAEIEDGGIDGQTGTLADRQTGPADGLSSSQGYPTNRQTNSYVTRQPGGDKDTRRLESATDSDAMRQSTCATDAMSTSIIEADVFSFGGGGDMKTEKCVLYNKLSDQTRLAKTNSVVNERAKTDPFDMDTGAYRTEEKASDTDIFSTPTENPSNRDFLSTPAEVFSTAPASTGSGDRHPAQSPLGPDSAVDRPVSTSSVSSPARHDNSRLYRMHRTKNSPVGATGHHGGKSGPVSTLHGPVSSFRGPVSSLRGPVSTAGSPKRASVNDIWASWEESPPPNKKVTNDDLMSPVRRKVSGISLRGDRK